MYLLNTGKVTALRGGGGGISYNGLYDEAPTERGTFFRLQGNKRVGISPVVKYVKG